MLATIEELRPSIHRPRIVLLAHPEMRTGGRVRGTVRVIAKRPTHVRSLVAEWMAAEEVTFGRGQHTARKTYRVPDGGVEILGATTLAPGQHDYPLDLPIPNAVTPSYSGRKCSTHHSLVLRLEIPWWLDRRTTFELPVQQGQAERRYPGEPILFASRAGGPEAKKPFIEGSLATDVVAPGDLLRGAVALLNTEHNRYTKLTIALVGSEYLHDGSVREYGEVTRLAVDIEMGSPEEGQSFPLALRIPKGLPVSARGSLWSMCWSFQVLARVRFGRDETLEIPLTVAPEHLHSDANLLRAVPRVGTARQVALWQSVAHAHHMRCEGGVMRTSVGAISVEVSREHLGRKGWCLVATLRYPSLRMGIAIRESSLLRKGGLKLGRGAWSRAHHIRARCSEQAVPVLGSLVLALEVFAAVRMSDSELRLERPGGGLRRRKLADFVEGTLRCAEAIELLPAQVTAPPEFMADAEGWRELASKLDGHVHLADMSIRAQYRGVAICIEHEWLDGELVASTIRAVELMHQDSASCFVVAAEEAEGFSAETLPKLRSIGLSAARKRALDHALCGATRFASKAEEDALTVPAILSASQAMQRISALVAFSASRARLAGPYR